MRASCGFAATFGGYDRIRERHLPIEEEAMKSLLRRLAIMAAPIVWRKIQERRRRGR
jgi:hypothetical protein